ncbi:hypothetical protein LWM68_15500 [Niabella sp. W65]|nr:hypothetical protein [Niabella sp. W65]MCH7364036.1 hypothetical protein [Niabella sp. W65]ULT39914.1 hypothetical protein KRR40_34300 [Niabella sp. I65]
MALSDYWNQQDSATGDTVDEEGEELTYEDETESKPRNNAINSYRNIQNELGSFYKDNNGEAEALRQQVEMLKQELEEKASLNLIV